MEKEEKTERERDVINALVTVRYKKYFARFTFAYRTLQHSQRHADAHAHMQFWMHAQSHKDDSSSCVCLKWRSLWQDLLLEENKCLCPIVSVGMLDQIQLQSIASLLFCFFSSSICIHHLCICHSILLSSSQFLRILPCCKVSLCHSCTANTYSACK